MAIKDGLILAKFLQNKRTLSEHRDTFLFFSVITPTDTLQQELYSQADSSASSKGEERQTFKCEHPKRSAFRYPLSSHRWACGKDFCQKWHRISTEKLTMKSYSAVSFRCQYKLCDFSSLKWLGEKGIGKEEKREKKKKKKRIVLELTLGINAVSAGIKPYWVWNSTLLYSAVQICLTGDGCAQRCCHNNWEHADICIRGSV